jgi:hypothetical protein
MDLRMASSVAVLLPVTFQPSILAFLTIVVNLLVLFFTTTLALRRSYLSLIPNLTYFTYTVSLVGTGTEFLSTTWCINLTGRWITLPPARCRAFIYLFLNQLFANFVYPSSQYDWFQFNICALPSKNNAKEVNNKLDQLAKENRVENGPSLVSCFHHHPPLYMTWVNVLLSIMCGKGWIICCGRSNWSLRFDLPQHSLLICQWIDVVIIRLWAQNYHQTFHMYISFHPATWSTEAHAPHVTCHL